MTLKVISMSSSEPLFIMVCSSLFRNLDPEFMIFISDNMEVRRYHYNKVGGVSLLYPTQTVFVGDGEGGCILISCLSVCDVLVFQYLEKTIMEFHKI